MIGETCAHWRGLIAMDVVGHLDPEDRLALTAHLDGCTECRQEADDLAMLGSVLTMADVEHLESDANETPAELQSAVFDRLRADALRARRRRRARTVVGVAAAACIIAVALVLSLSGGSPGSVSFALTAPTGVHATATVTPESWGTQLNLQVTGEPGGQVLYVSMRTTSGGWWAAGTFRTAPGNGTLNVMLGCALPKSEIRSVWVRDDQGRVLMHGSLD